MFFVTCRRSHAIAAACTLNFVGIGWIFDATRLKTYVAEAAEKSQSVPVNLESVNVDVRRVCWFSDRILSCLHQIRMLCTI